MKIKFERATLEDVEVLINIRNQCFYLDYVKYGECPGYNLSKESMANTILKNIGYKIVYNNEIVGNISISNNSDSIYHIGCLCVLPDYENKGIGQEAIRFIESQFPNVAVWTLDTPADKERNIYFYKKAGYNIIKEYMGGSVRLVLFEKKIKLRKEN
jgi:ribosomal protein S18 acetylase RimI-like enzyme